MQALRPVKKTKFAKKFRHILRFKWLYIMLIPAFLYYFIFKFLPLLNLRIIFQYYLPQNELLGKPIEWLGLRSFAVFFQHRDFWLLLRNTVYLAGLNVIFYFPFPIFLALLLNEVRAMRYKRIVQSVLYLPHFISWAVLASIMLMLLGPSPNGLVNNVLVSTGRQEIQFMASEAWFRPMYLIEIIWKESGWGTIIYLAALSGVDEQLYEAAVIDGAGRFKQLWHITLPCIRPTIIVLLILRMGSFLDNGFDQIYLMRNSLNREVAEVFDTYIYEIGLKAKYSPAPGISNYSYSAAVGVFRSVIGLGLMMFTNRMAKLAGEEGI